MSRRSILVCDRHKADDEVRADETVTFTTGAGKYEIDLCNEHRDEWDAFNERFEAWVAAARLIEPAAAPADTPRNRSSRDRLENGAIRAWAREQGIELGERGRIPEEIRQRFRDEVGAQARERWNQVARNRSTRNGHVPEQQVGQPL